MANLNVRKRGDRWEWRFEAAPVAGKRRQRSRGGFRTKREALEAGTKALAEYNGTGAYSKPAETSVADVLDLWLERYVGANLRPKTRDSYRSIVEIHLKPAFGHMRASGLQPAALQDFADGLRGLSRHHAVNILSVLKNALGYAVEPLRLIPSNPMLGVRAPRVTKPPKRREVVPPYAPKAPTNG